MPELLLAFAANPDAGKTTTFSEYASKKYGLPIATGSSILKKWAAEEGVALTARPDFTAYQIKARQERGDNCIMEEALRSYRNENGLIYDGMRNMFDLEGFRPHGGVVIACWCDFDTRLERAVERADGKDNVDPTEFQAAETAEYDSANPFGAHTLRIMQMADYHIDATRPVERCQQQLDRIITEVVG